MVIAELEVLALVGIGKAKGFRKSRGNQESAPAPTAVDITLNLRRDEKCPDRYVARVPFDLRARSRTGRRKN